MTTTARMLDEIKIDGGGFFQGWSCKGLIKKRTVIFGRNGSGKSTLVRHLRDEHHSESTSASTVVAETDLDVLVFNEDYVRENLGGVIAGSGALSALFVTGEVNVETEADFDAATKEQARVDERIGAASQRLTRSERDLKNAQEAAREGVRSLPEESGSMNSATAEKRLRETDPCNDGDDSEDRRTLTTDVPSIPDPVEGIPDDLVDIDLSVVSEVLARDVVADASSALSALTPEQRSWVEKGAELHVHRRTCLLCENALVPPRSIMLAAMRTQELLQLRGDLERLSEALETQTRLAESLITNLSTKVKRIDTSAIDLGEVETELRVVVSYLKVLSARVARKISQPREMIEGPDDDRPPTPLFDQLRSIIAGQNEQWEQRRHGLDNEKSRAAARCLGRLRVTHLAKIDGAKADFSSAREEVNSLKKESEEINAKIGELQARRLNTNDAAPLAAQLTRDLRSYLGHDELTVQVEVEGEATGFALYRSNGHRASGLSEGERTAISLLHFIRSLQESERLSKLRETCVVLDDPVSSLDGQSIRNAFHFIVNAMDNGHGADKVGQYLVFTHSEAFFGLWRDKLTNRSGTIRSSSALLRLDARQTDGAGQRVPFLEAFPPGAVKYRSEYYRLFDQVIDAVEQQSNFIDQGVANVTRRLMESFARWKGPNVTDLRDSFERLVGQVSPESQVERFGSVLHFLQSGSHFEEIDIDTEAESVSNYRNDVVACLALMRAADPAHFEGMFLAVRATGEGTNVQEQFVRICGVLDSKSPFGDANGPEAAS